MPRMAEASTASGSAVSTTRSARPPTASAPRSGPPPPAGQSRVWILEALHARQSLARLPAVRRQSVAVLPRGRRVETEQRLGGGGEVVGTECEVRAGRYHAAKGVDPVAVVDADPSVLHRQPVVVRSDKIGVDREDDPEGGGAVEVGRSA